MQTRNLQLRLEGLYQKWHLPTYLETDPVCVVKAAPAEDQEVIGFLVSCLAIGRAQQISLACKNLLARIGPRVTQRLAAAEPGAWGTGLDGFVYRFFSSTKVAALLDALGVVLRTYGSLEAAWRSSPVRGWGAIDAFAALFRLPGRDPGVLVPVEGTSGASKRINLFLRWMVRRDQIDLGLWNALSPSELFMPIDTHVLQWAQEEGLTLRRVADRQACDEITAALRALSPTDPLRYDFCITRDGMSRKNTLRTVT